MQVQRWQVVHELRRETIPDLLWRLNQRGLSSREKPQFSGDRVCGTFQTTTEWEELGAISLFRILLFSKIAVVRPHYL